MNNKYIAYKTHSIVKKNFIKIPEILHTKKWGQYLWGSKIWARNLGPGTTFYQQYAQGEEITEDRCN